MPSIPASLPDDMDKAADILVEATRVYNAVRGYDSEADPELQDWRPANLRYVAGQLREQDREERLRTILRVHTAGIMGEGEVTSCLNEILQNFELHPRKDGR